MIEIYNKYLCLLKDFQMKMNYHLSVIVAEILKEMNPIAIYLIGSFGREEGSLRVSKDGHIAPVRDYDILVIVDKKIESEKIRRIVIRVNKILGFAPPNSDFKFKSFCIWITQTTLKEINSLPLLKFYELRESSRLLWGHDIRRLINVRLNMLLKYNFVLILFSKIHGLLGLLELNVLHENRNYEAIDFIYECLKTYVEIGTCLSLLAGTYKPSFIERSLEVEKSFDYYFYDLRKKVPDLPQMISYCAYRRLILDDDYLNTLKLKDLFIKTRNDLKLILNYFVEKLYGTCLLLKELDTKVIEEVLNFYLMNRFKVSRIFLLKLITQLYLRYSCLNFFIEGRKKGYRVKIRILLYRQSNIMMRLWLLGLKALESIREDLTIDTEILNEILHELDKIVYLDHRENIISQSPEIKFTYIKKIIVELMNIADKTFHRKDY